MILIGLHIVLLIGLLFCLYQDLKDRTIHLALFGVILVSTLALNYIIGNNWMNALYSSLFLGVNLLCLFIYVSIKQKKLVNIFNAHLGLGDVLFFLAIIPLFSLRNFILFFISGMLLSMLFHLILNKYQKHATIPLAGYLSLFLISIVLFSVLSSNYSVLKVDLI